MGHTAYKHPDIIAFLTIFPEDEISSLWAASSGPRMHPLCELIGDMANPSPLALETIRAIRLVSQNDPAWMNHLRARLLNAANFTDSAATLGEIRAYGTLAMAGLKPKAINEDANPDFRIELGGQTIIVEVHTRQMDIAAQARIDAWANETRAATPPPGVSVQFSPSIAPFGEPDPRKPGDTVIANMISRIAAVKEREHQFQDGLANVLWLDLRSGPGSMLVDTNHALPFASRAGRVSSGALWSAAYGTRGMSIVEGPSHGRHVIVPMGHDGKFCGKPTKLSGIIAACNDGFVLLEHPSPAVALPLAFRNALLMHMDFRAERSVCAWGDGSEVVSRTVATQAMLLHAIVTNLRQPPFVYQDSYTSPTRTSAREGYTGSES